jgi:hypothetical protein
MKPPRLHPQGASDLERRLIKAAAGERPSGALRQRMAAGLGITAVAPVPLEPGLRPHASTTGSGVNGAGAATSKGALGTKLLVAVGSGVALSAGALTWFLATPSAPETQSVSGASGTSELRAPEVQTLAERAALPQAPQRSATDVATPIVNADDAISPSAAEAPSPSRQRGRTSAVSADLREQIALLDAARSALGAGSADSALATLGKYQSKYPRGSFGPETTALKVEALVKLGRRAEAKALGERFVSAHRDTALAQRVARVAGIEAP